MRIVQRLRRILVALPNNESVAAQYPLFVNAPYSYTFACGSNIASPWNGAAIHPFMVWRCVRPPYPPNTLPVMPA